MKKVTRRKFAQLLTKTLDHILKPIGEDRNWIPSTLAFMLGATSRTKA